MTAKERKQDNSKIHIISFMTFAIDLERFVCSFVALQCSCFCGGFVMTTMRHR